MPLCRASSALPIEVWRNACRLAARRYQVVVEVLVWREERKVLARMFPSKTRKSARVGHGFSQQERLPTTPSPSSAAHSPIDDAVPHRTTADDERGASYCLCITRAVVAPSKRSQVASLCLLRLIRFTSVICSGHEHHPTNTVPAQRRRHRRRRIIFSSAAESGAFWCPLRPCWL